MKHNNWLAVIPSGTKPNTKFYYSVKAESSAFAELLLKNIREQVLAIDSEVGGGEHGVLSDGIETRTASERHKKNTAVCTKTSSNIVKKPLIPIPQPATLVLARS